MPPLLKGLAKVLYSVVYFLATLVTMLGLFLLIILLLLFIGSLLF